MIVDYAAAKGDTITSAAQIIAIIHNLQQRADYHYNALNGKYGVKPSPNGDDQGGVRLLC